MSQISFAEFTILIFWVSCALREEIRGRMGTKSPSNPPPRDFHWIKLFSSWTERRKDGSKNLKTLPTWIKLLQVDTMGFDSIVFKVESKQPFSTSLGGRR